VIVCSCNVLTKAQILAAMSAEPDLRRSPAQTYRCLGCAPQCGRCLVTIRKILDEARLDACQVGCAACPGHAHVHEDDEAPAPGKPVDVPVREVPVREVPAYAVAAE
jgi:bacterioferritin-associated ferredoxin